MFWMGQMAEIKWLDPARTIARITVRRDYLRTAKGQRAARPTLVLQAIPQKPGLHETPRIGFTCSKKVGKAVARNRARRRLTHAARDVMSQNARPGFDYVVIGRSATVEAAFDDIVRDLQSALKSVHTPRQRSRRDQPKETRK